MTYGEFSERGDLSKETGESGSGDTADLAELREELKGIEKHIDEMLAGWNQSQLSPDPEERLSQGLGYEKDLEAARARQKVILEQINQREPPPSSGRKWNKPES